MNGYLIAGCVLGVLSLLLIAVIYVLLSVKQKKDEVKEVLPKVLSRVDMRFQDALVVDFDSEEIPQCYVNVSDKITLVNSLGKEYSFSNSHFPGGAGFNKLFDIILRELYNYVNYSHRDSFSIKCCIDTSDDSKAMNDYQMIRAVLCAVYGVNAITRSPYHCPYRKKLKVIVSSKHAKVVKEILDSENYQDFYACDGSSPSMSEYLEKYMQST